MEIIRVFLTSNLFFLNHVQVVTQLPVFYFHVRAIESWKIPKRWTFIENYGNLGYFSIKLQCKYIKTGDNYTFWENHFWLSSKLGNTSRFWVAKCPESRSRRVKIIFSPFLNPLAPFSGSFQLFTPPLNAFEMTWSHF